MDNKLYETVLKEYGTQADFNRYLKQKQAFDNFETRTSVSDKDKWNLRMDIKKFKKEFEELQDTCSDLPDSYVEEVCDYSDYPFEEPIDEVEDVNKWCDDADAFLADSSLSIPEF